MATFWATNSKNGYFWFQHLVTLAPSLSDAQPDCETLSRVNNELRHKSSSTRYFETLLQSLLIFVNEILCKFCVQNRFQTRKKPEKQWVEVVLFPRLKTLKIKIKHDAYFFSSVQICQIPRHCCCSHFGYFSCYGQSTVVKRLAS